MSWLNLNQSLSSIKGQITSFASEVLNEGAGDDEDPFVKLDKANQKILELESLCATQDKEIKTLRRKNAEYHQERVNLSVSQTSLQQPTASNDSSQDDSSWFWDPPEESAKQDDKEDNLQAKIKSLQDEISHLKTQQLSETETLKKDLNYVRNENASLVRSLEDLDNQNQIEIEKIMLIKKELQQNYDTMRKDYDAFIKEHERKMLELQDCSGHNEKLRANHLTLQVKYDKLETAYRLLTENTGRFQEDNQFMAEENEKLKADLDDLSVKFENLEQSNKLLAEEMDKAQEEIHELTEENFKLQEERTKLQDDSENSTKNKNINVVTTEQYQELEEKFSKLEMQVASKVPPKILGIESSSAQIIIEQLKLEIVELQNKLNTNEEIKRLNLENVNLRKELELLSDNIPCKAIKEIFEKHIGVDKNIKYSYLSNDMLDYVDSCLSSLLQYKNRNETLEIRCSEDSKEINKLKSKIDQINEEMYILNTDLTQCEHECNEMKKNNDFLIAEIGALKSSKLEPILEQNEDNVLMLQNELEDCSNLNKSFEEKLEKYKEELNSAKLEIVELKKLAEAEDEYKQLTSDMKVETDRLRAENEKQKIDISIIDNEKVLLMKELADVKADLATKSIITDHVRKLEMEKADLENSLINQNELSVKLEATIKENDELKISVENLSTQIKISENKFSEIRQTMIEKDEELLKTTKLLNERLEGFSQKMDSDAMDLSKVQAQCNGLADKLNQVTNERDGLEESVKELKSNETELKTSLESMKENVKKLQSENEQLVTLNNDFIKNQKDSSESDDLIQSMQTIKSQYAELEKTIKVIEKEKETVEAESNEYSRIVKEDQVKIAEFGLLKMQMESQLNSINNEKVELINLVKQKHEENVNYHNEIQRLNEILVAECEKFKKLEEINLILCKEQSIKPEECTNCSNLAKALQERDTEVLEIKKTLEEVKNIKVTQEALEKITEKNQFLAEKCDVLAKSLLQEQSVSKQVAIEKSQVLEREQNLSKEIERLRQHLLEIEDLHTQELIGAEQKCQELQTSLCMTEEKAKHYSTTYTSNSIRANQEVETLRNQLKLIEKQRDDIQVQLYQSEDRNNKNLAALTNLQCVLEQFQMDKSQDVEEASIRLRRDLDHSLAEKHQLQNEIQSLRDKLVESNNGLKAAARLSAQLDTRAAQLDEMKENVSKLEDDVALWKQKYHNTISNQQDRVDKSLVKNLVIGLIQASTNEKKDQRVQTLKILSTVLDFDQKETERVGLATPSAHHESLMQEFVKFMERESRPPLNAVLPNLLNIGQGSSDGGKPPSRRTSELGSPPQIQENLRTISPSSQRSNDSRSSPAQNASPRPVPIPIMIAPDIAVKPNEAGLVSGNAILDGVSSDLITGVNQTRNTQGAILKNVLLDS